MPFKVYHGRTGKVWNVTKRAVGVEVNKQVRLSLHIKHPNMNLHGKPNDHVQHIIGQIVGQPPQGLLIYPAMEWVVARQSSQIETRIPSTFGSIGGLEVATQAGLLCQSLFVIVHCQDDIESS